MKKRILFALAAVMALSQGVTAQRVTDVLGRGLVAMKTDKGVFCSWRITADEWEGTQYNIYRGNTKLNDAPLKVSNFTDPAGTTGATYTVKAVVNGVEAEACKPVSVWEKNYTVITPKHSDEISVALVPNDATVADVDGDGELEIIIKYDNTAPVFYKGDNGIFTVVECLEMDGTVKWWINFGPNMGDFQNNEINIIAYDWDGDGKAEVVFRAADGTVIHQADGSTYTVGDASINYRGTATTPPSSAEWFMHWGKEYLIYADGLTCKPYECIDFPLKRVEDANNPNGLLSGSAYDKLVENEWGDGYGHRSSKYFFAAPYLDGRKPSLFLGRGIYTRHKFITYDIDPASHKLVERWRWNSPTSGPWYGQGYHNMGIADVDLDGRDEIVYGSMVIDDNGRGLSTTGLGHGDAQHCGDFDPYTRGLEIFACNEDSPNNNYRDATTSKIYYRTVSGSDDGRSNMGNFIDEYPGSEGVSAHDDNLIGGASHKAIVGDNKNSVSIAQNFRVFWDGDLCDESFNYVNGKNTAGAIYKGKVGQIALLEGSKTNNDTKGTPCFQGDILGDWREEYIMRDADNNIRIYSTDFPTEHRIYSLWYDHQYRNAMCWQMCGYNQPPHVSFALSQFEGITVPPAPFTMTGRTEVANNGAIDASLNGKHVIICENGDMTVSAADGVMPSVLTVNAPVWTQGHDSNDNITTTTYTHTISGGTFAGTMKLIKQGEGVLVMPAGKHTYSGATEVWGGTFALDGELSESSMWLNRFSTLRTSSLSVPKGIDMEYGAVISLGDDTKAGSLTAGALTLGFGAIVELDVFADNSIDHINASEITVETKDWTNGPEYLQPVIRLIDHPADGQDLLPAGRYLIGKVDKVNGNLSDIILLGMDNMKKSLVYEDGNLYLDLVAYDSGVKTWVGGDSAVWDLDNSKAFANADAESDVFVPGDEVIFDDSALSTDITVSGKLLAKNVTFNNSEKNYTLSGNGQIVGSTRLTKEGTGTLTVNNINAYTGGTYIKGGKLVAGVFANNIGTDLGALSDINSRIYMSGNSTLSVSATGTIGQRITVSSGDATIETPTGVTATLTSGIAGGSIGQKIIKSGAGTLNMAGGNTMTRLVIENGVVNASEVDGVISLPSTVEFVRGSLYDADNIYSTTNNSVNYYVGEGNSGSLYLDSRCNYKGKLTGSGTLTVYARSVRNYLQGDWSGFEGTVVAGYAKSGSYDPQFLWDNNYGMPKATLNIGNGVTFETGSRSVKLGNITGSGIYLGTGTLTIGNDDKMISFSGSFSGKPKIVKTGKCEWRLTKELKEITNFTARDGFVSFGTPTATTKTTYFTVPLIIEGNSTLRGCGTAADITVSGNGTLCPGKYDKEPYVGAIYSTGKVTVNQGATLSLYIRAAAATNAGSSINVTGALTVNGTVKVALHSSYKPKAGDSFTLWTAASFAGTPTLELPELPEGFQWDTSALNAATGVLKVAESSGIASITADEPVICKVYSALGLCLGTVNTTKATATTDVKRELNLGAGLYILRLEGQNGAETLKVRF